MSAYLFTFVVCVGIGNPGIGIDTNLGALEHRGASCIRALVPRVNRRESALINSVVSRLLPNKMFLDGLATRDTTQQVELSMIPEYKSCSCSEQDQILQLVSQRTDCAYLLLQSIS